MKEFSFIHSSFHGNELTLSQLCGFIAELVEHCIGIAEVMGSHPVESAGSLFVYKRQLLKL